MGLILAFSLLRTPVDEFERLEGAALVAAAKATDAPARERLTVADLGTLPTVLPGVRSPLLVVVTGEKNLARLIVSPALRNQPGGGEPIPILLVERFDTFEAGPATTRLARGRDLVLFDGFRLDLDSGQVVPDGQGGDLRFVVAGDGGPRLVPIEPATIHVPAKSPMPEAEPDQPSPGRAVLEADFAGTYQMFANGQATGRPRSENRRCRRSRGPVSERSDRRVVQGHGAGRGRRPREVRRRVAPRPPGV